MSTTQREILGVSGRAVRWIMIFVLLSLATLSCKDDRREYKPTPPIIGGNADVIFEINVPQSTVPSTYAIDKEDEDQIKTIEILLFKIDPNDPNKKEYTGKPYYCDIISSGTGLNSANKHFIVSLPAGGAYDIVVLANSREVVNKLLVDTPPTVTAKDDLLKLLKIEHNTKWIADKNDLNYKPFPMWGELENKTISENLRFQTKMMRMLAKIDVTLSTPTAIASFELKEVILVNAHTQGRIVPDKNNIALDGRVNKPTLVDGSITNVNKLHYTDATTTNIGFVNTIYTFEAEGATPSTLSKATFIIVKGLYVADSKEYFYKLDLGEKTGGTIVYHHILRNFQYSIGISRIGGAGYTTLDEAIAGPSSNIESTLVVWDNNELPIVVWDNDNALGFSTDDITLGYAAGASKPLKVMTDYTGGWKVDKIVDDFGAAVDWLTLSPMKSTAGKEISMEELEFTVTENIDPVARVCWVYISAGALQHKVKVTQREKMNIGKIIWEDYDGETGVKTNDDGTTDTGLTSITVTQSDGTVQTSTISNGDVTPIMKLESAIASVVVTYKGYELSVPVGKYSYDILTKTLTVTDRSLIGKAVHLNKVRDDLAGNYIQVSDVNLSAYANWVPIGVSVTEPFTGSYTGGYATNKYKISNLTIDRPTEDYIGLFGSASGATLTKIHIASGSVEGNIAVGTICGYNIDVGTISECTNYATITSKNDGAGGICGYNSNSAISGCTNAATVTGADSLIGGICGYNTGGTISNCTNAGTVTGTDSLIGGICGVSVYASAQIIDCHNLVGGNISGVEQVGGICGNNSGSAISDCTNAATVTGTGSLVSGICGVNYDHTISNCTNSGAIKGFNQVGGICGYNTGGTISNCTNAAAIIGTSGFTLVGGICGENSGTTVSKIINCDNLSGGNVSGVSLVGGIAGTNGGFFERSSSGAISGCTNAATVTGTGDNVGGIAGNNNPSINTKITNCENLSTGNVNGVGNVGGVCGKNGDNFSLPIDPGAPISGCTNAATVTGTENFVGGICGKNSGPISDGTNSGNVIGTGDSVGGICGVNIGKTTTITDCKNLLGGNISGVNDVGGICGASGISVIPYTYHGGAISGCTNAATVTGSGNSVGGICGNNFDATISDCTNSATVKGTDPTSKYIGGICGYNLGAAAETSNCENLAGANVSGTSNVGGILGNNGEAAISGCTNAATVEGIGATSNYIGGICGYNKGTTAEITGCDNLLGGNVSGVAYVGGICGSNGDATAIPAVPGGPISGCTNAATVTGTGSNVGGISGTNSGSTATITSCNNLVGGSVSGATQVGGICGNNIGTISGCTNEATVEGTGSYVGGICGYNSGTVSGCTNKDSVTGTTDKIGGIVGQNANVSSKITSCHNEAGGNVSGQESVGGICGNNSGTISSCTNDAIVTAESMNGGGICGNNFTDGKIYACINTKTAAVSGGNNIGGIAGFNYASTVINACYNLALIGTATSRGAIVGKFAITVVNPVDCYFGENANFSSTTGSTKFGDGIGGTGWPNVGMTNWSEYHATNNPDGYWLDIGSWPSGGTPTYPQLYRKPVTP